MTNLFPTLPGLTFDQKKTPTWKTLTTESLSGKRTSVGLMEYPIWEFSLAFELLREERDLYEEFQMLAGFFNQQKGSLIPFNYWDPNDNWVSLFQFDTGDGSTKDFQLMKPLGDTLEPVQSLAVPPNIFIIDWRSDATTEQTLIQTCLQYYYARKNYLKYSQSLQTTSAWTVSGSVSVTNNTSETVAPDGTSTAAKITGIGDISTNRISQTVTIPSSQRTEPSFYIKKISTSGTLQVRQATSGISTGQWTINLALVGTGWERITRYHAAVTVVHEFHPSSTSALFILAAVSGTLSAYIWGCQLECGQYSTPYIPTTTAAVEIIDYSLSDDGIVSFANAPADGVGLLWTGSYYQYVHFMQDSTEFNLFMQDFWEAQEVTFRTWKK